MLGFAQLREVLTADWSAVHRTVSDNLIEDLKSLNLIDKDANASEFYKKYYRIV